MIFPAASRSRRDFPRRDGQDFWGCGFQPRVCGGGTRLSRPPGTHLAQSPPRSRRGGPWKTIETRFAGIEKLQAAKDSKDTKNVSRRDAKPRRLSDRILKMDRLCRLVDSRPSVSIRGLLVVPRPRGPPGGRTLPHAFHPPSSSSPIPISLSVAPRLCGKISFFLRALCELGASFSDVSIPPARQGRLAPPAVRREVGPCRTPPSRSATQRTRQARPSHPRNPVKLVNPVQKLNLPTRLPIPLPPPLPFPFPSPWRRVSAGKFPFSFAPFANLARVFRCFHPPARQGRLAPPAVRPEVGPCRTPPSRSATQRTRQARPSPALFIVRAAASFAFLWIPPPFPSIRGFHPFRNTEGARPTSSRGV